MTEPLQYERAHGGEGAGGYSAGPFSLPLFRGLFASSYKGDSAFACGCTLSRHLSGISAAQAS